jgi:hypothetical protein
MMLRGNWPWRWRVSSGRPRSIQSCLTWPIIWNWRARQSGADLPPRHQGESDEDYAARLNDAGVVAAASGQRQRAEAAFAQAIELKSRWYARAASNLAALDGAK